LLQQAVKLEINYGSSYELKIHRLFSYVVLAGYVLVIGAKNTFVSWQQPD
jgi:hypothetical protein